MMDTERLIRLPELAVWTSCQTLVYVYFYHMLQVASRLDRLFLSTFDTFPHRCDQLSDRLKNRKDLCVIHQ